jgi:hypothetical protein
MAENKTQPTKASVKSYLDKIKDPAIKADCYKIAEIFESAVKAKGVMWGESLVGFGQYHYKYESGREGDFFLAGFAPRAKNITLYILPGCGNFPELTAQLGKFKASGSCIHIKRLEDIDIKILKKLLAASLKKMKALYGPKKK